MLWTDNLKRWKEERQILLKEREQFSVPELARKHGCSEASINKRLAKAKRDNEKS